MKTESDPRLTGFFGIKQPTIGLFMEDGRRVAHTLPAKSIVKVVEGQVGPQGLLEVVWNGKPVLMFAIDLRNRGEKIDL